MPLYEYECQSCHYNFEQVQKMADSPLLNCPQCKIDALVRIINPPILAKVISPRTVGTLAEHNAKNMSSEEKAIKEEEHRTKKLKEHDTLKYLPKGMYRKKKQVVGDKPWYKQNQTVSNKQLQKMTSEQKRKYIETGKT